MCGFYSMISLELDDAVVLEQQQVLEKALSTNPKTQAALRKLIKRVIMQARAEVVSNIHFKNGDPRNSARAVRTAVYKKILGANINIYDSRKKHGTQNYTPPRTLHPGQRGGNRRVRHFRDMGIYAPEDRGFILRWVNEGMTKTNPRVVKFTPNESRKVDKWNKHPNTGNRGAIAPRNFFRGAAERALVKATGILAEMIDTELEEMLNKKK